jgi:hypothetical protein
MGGKDLYPEDLRGFLEILGSVERECRVLYYRIEDWREDLVRSIETEIYNLCGDKAYFQIYGDGILVTTRVAMASMVRLRRAMGRGYRIARKESIELLLRTLGVRSISQAVDLVRAREPGLKNLVLITCGDCVPKVIGGLAKRYEPSRGELIDGLRGLVSICIGDKRALEILGTLDLEALEKIAIECGAKIELEL